jgi:hypothetical protein
MDRLVFAFFLSTFLICSAEADLTWVNPVQQFTASPGQKQVEAKYAFANKSDKPVTIIGVKTSCGCTSATLEKKIYAPDESGQIDVTFQTEGRTGLQEKTIMVMTAASPNQPTFLQLKVNIPQVLVLQPQFVFWTTGEKAEPKMIRAKIGNDYPAKIVSVESDSPDITVETKMIAPSKEMEIKLTPKNPSRPSGVTILIKTDYPPKNPRTYYAYARVKD